MTFATQERNAAASFPRIGHRYVPIADKTSDGEIVGHAVQTISRDAHSLYEFWRDVRAIPRWQENVVSVTPLTERTSHWVMGNPEDVDGKRVEFDSEITEDIPGRLLAWRSITDGVSLSGSVTFQESPSGRGTCATLSQRFKLPGGSLTNGLAGLAKRSPQQVITENLRHFKQMAETAEIPSVKGQPHGPRGLTGTFKEWMYGEINPTPPGTSDVD